MTSLIAWLDHDEGERRRMREVIDLFREHDTVDELGVGTVRDTIANILFPGITTIQTRTRYFIFIPWIFQEIERRRHTGRAAEAEARKLETKLIYALERGGHHAGEGVIGWEARDRLKRLPSSIYWSGLGRFGIRQIPGSQDDYFRSLEGYQQRLRQHSAGDGDEVHERFRPNWHTDLPAPPQNWLEETDFDLLPAESEFLAERIVASARSTLLAHLVVSDTDVSGATMPWDLPDLDRFSPDITRTIDHARRFSHVMHAAPLVYNLMLAKLSLSLGMSGRYGEWRDKHTHELETWVEELKSPHLWLDHWDLREFWMMIDEKNPGVPSPTRRFINQWISLAQRSPNLIGAGAEEVRQIIRLRERQMKGSQARLFSRRALERWTGEAGTRQFEYRWPVTRVMLSDIRQGFVNAPS